MAKDFNSVTISGRIGRDCELVATQTGKELVKFSFACNNYQGEAQWFECISFAQNHKKLQPYLEKGKRLVVQGEISAQAYLSKQGEPKAKLTIMVRDLVFISNPQASDQDKPRTKIIGGEEYSEQQLRELSTDQGDYKSVNVPF